jgi:hypothetical protein
LCRDLRQFGAVGIRVAPVTPRCLKLSGDASIIAFVTQHVRECKVASSLGSVVIEHLCRDEFGEVPVSRFHRAPRHRLQTEEGL